MSPGRRLKPGSRKRVPFPLNRGNKYKDFVNIFPGPNLMSPEWRGPLNKGVPKGSFHCISLQLGKNVLHCQNRDIVVSWIPEVFFFAHVAGYFGVDRLLESVN